MTGPARTVFGPPRTPGETVVCAVGSALVMALLTVYIGHVGGWHDRSVLQIVVLGLIIFDLIFGMFTISTATAKNYYHRPGADVRRFRAGFVLAHLGYLVAAAALFDTGWAWAFVNAGLLLGAAAAIDFTPADLRRLAAIGLTVTACLINLIWLPLPATMAWLPVLLFVKVLACFLLHEGPTVMRASRTPVSAPGRSDAALFTVPRSL